MAISEQEEFEFRRRAEAERGTAPIAAPPKDPNAFAKAARITGNEWKAGTDEYKGAMKVIHDKGLAGQSPSIGDMLAPPLAALKAFPGAPVKGVADATFGDTPIYGHMTGGDIAQIALPFAGEGANLVRGAVTELPKVGSAIADLLNGTRNGVKAVTGAGRRAAGASDAMRAEAASTFSSGQAEAEAAAKAASDRSARAAALAQRAKARQGALAARQAEASKSAMPPELDIGTPAHLSDIGDTVRKPALAAQSSIETEMQAADAQHRAAMEAIGADRAASGVGVSDMPTAKALIKNSKDLVAPDPITRPEVGPMGNSDQTKLHSMLLKTLEPEVIPLNAEDAAKAIKAGFKVDKAPDGSFSRTVKPNMKSVDELRRFVGKVAGGNVEGYGAINQIEAGKMYRDLSGVLDEYAQGAREPVQANWRAGKKALEPFERVRAGQAIVGTQKGTDIASVPASSIPGRIISGGRDTVQQAGAVAGKAPVSSALRSLVQNKLTGVKGADAIEKVVGPGSTIGDAIKTDGDLSSAVQEYLNQTKAAERFGTHAEDLGKRAASSGNRAKRLSDVAEALQGTSAKAVTTAGGHARNLANLEIADPAEVGSMYSSMLDEAHKAGTIDITKYAQGKQLAASAQKDFALKASRDAWLKKAALLMGVGSPLTAAGWKLTHH